MLFEDRRLAPYHGEEPYLFLSYSHRDADRAAELILRLKQEGFRVWYDEGVIPATAWDETIAQAIIRCSFFVSLISEAYLASSNCLDELNYARDLNKPQLLIYLEDVMLPEGLQMRLGRLLAVYRSRYRNPDTFYAKVFRAEGIAVCRGSADPEEDGFDGDDAFFDTELSGGASQRHRASAYPVRSGSQTGRLIAVLAAVMLLITAALAWNYRGDIQDLVSGFGHGYQAKQDASAESPVPYIAPDPSPTPAIEDTTAEIIPEATPTPAPAETVLPVITPEPSAEPAVPEPSEEPGPSSETEEPASGTDEDLYGPSTEPEDTVVVVSPDDGPFSEFPGSSPSPALTEPISPEFYPG